MEQDLAAQMIRLATGIAIFLGIVITVCLVVPALPTIRGLLLGVEVPPAIVSSVRNLASVLGSLAVGWLLLKTTSLQGTKLVVLMIPLTGLINNTWGFIDQWLKKDQNKKDPPAVAGSGPNTPLNPTT